MMASSAASTGLQAHGANESRASTDSFRSKRKNAEQTWIARHQDASCTPELIYRVVHQRSSLEHVTYHLHARNAGLAMWVYPHCADGLRGLAALMGLMGLMGLLTLRLLC